MLHRTFVSRRCFKTIEAQRVGKCLMSLFRRVRDDTCVCQAEWLPVRRTHTGSGEAIDSKVCGTKNV